MLRALVERARQGDEEAFGALARAVGDRCMAIAYRILRDVDLAEDAVQTALVTAWRELPALRDPDRFEPWLHRILTNACYAEARRSRRWAAEHPRSCPLDGATVADDVLTINDRDQLERGLPAAPGRAAGRARLPPLPRADAARGRRPTRHPRRDREVPPPLRNGGAARESSRPTPERRSLSQERPA